MVQYEKGLTPEDRKRLSRAIAALAGWDEFRLAFGWTRIFDIKQMIDLTPKEEGGK